MGRDQPSATRVLEIARLIRAHADLDDEDLVARLRGTGLASLDAELAVVFLPIGFARPILQQAGVAQFPETYLVQDRRGAWIERPLADEPWFRASLLVGVATVTHGFAAEGSAGLTASRAEFEAVMSRSPEVGAVSQALDAGVDVRGATFQPLRLLRLKAESLAARRWWDLRTR